MARKSTSFVDDLLSLPWWVSATLGLAGYGVFGFMLPWVSGLSEPAPCAGWFSAGLAFRGFAQAGPITANVTMLFFLAMTTLSLYNSFIRNRKGITLFENTRTGENLRSLHWRDFEKLVGAAYGRRGYAVTETREGADGGVDLVLNKDGETILVQCRHWRMEQVGVAIVRELLGVICDRKASKGIVITSGTFTREALDFCRGNPIDPVDGKALCAMIGAMETPADTNPVQDKPAPVLCPVCGAEMILRTAQRGPSVGTMFYGCSNYPACKCVRSY